MEKTVLVSAADAITARLVEEAGFGGIWVSGFEASARLGLADNGSITMTEMLNVAKPIVDAVNIPVWVDVDTGYGNFQRTVREFEKIGVAGVCVQDDLEGCKTNSLWGGDSPLMDVKDFCNKLNVNKSKIKIIARTESIIRGKSIQEAKSRIHFYSISGADIVLPHVRDWNDLLIPNQFNKLIDKDWAIVPTKFPSFNNKRLFDMGYSMVIWANQTERVKIKATRECLGSLMASDCAEYIEAHLSATLDDMKGLTPDV